MGWGNSAHGHKKTMGCPIDKCKYTSRQFVKISLPDSKLNDLANCSFKCPVHQTILVCKPEVTHPKK